MVARYSWPLCFHTDSSVPEWPRYTCTHLSPLSPAAAPPPTPPPLSLSLPLALSFSFSLLYVSLPDSITNLNSLQLYPHRIFVFCSFFPPHLASLLFLISRQFLLSVFTRFTISFFLSVSHPPSTDTIHSSQPCARVRIASQTHYMNTHSHNSHTHIGRL